MSQLLSLSQLSVAFGSARVLRDIDMTIHRGESVGLVGESGSGKSVCWLAVLGLLPGAASVSGQAMLGDMDLIGAPRRALESIRGRRIALINQEPMSSLNPVLTIGRQLGEALRLHRGLSGSSLAAEMERLLDRVGIANAKRCLNAYPHEFSGGQCQRIMIAMAIAGQPDLLIADEPTTALDVTVQAQIIDLLQEIRRDMNMALVLISHDLGLIAESCQRVVVLYAGRIVEEAPVDSLIDDALHPYSQGLIGALPPLVGTRGRLQAIPGVVPDARFMPPGCAFAPRCSERRDICADHVPALRDWPGNRRVACLARSTVEGGVHE